MKSVVVTGVSSGIGLAVAKVLIGQGVRVFGSVRKEADGKQVKVELGELFVPLIFDVTDEAAVARAASEVRGALKGQRLLGLVNNAGIAVAGPLLSQPIAEFRKQMEINVMGQVIVTQAFAPLLGVEPGLSGSPGRIVMIGSDAGQVAAPFLAAYSASKHAIEGVADSLRRELLLFGIDVIVIGPGFVVTKIWDKAEEMDMTPYLNTPYEGSLKKIRDYMLENGRKGYPAERIARTVWRALSTAKPKPRYAEVKGYVENYLLPKILPKRVLDRIIGWQLGLIPKK
jgi:NAD(P)-dependent dehydrogenase (short-subunit alcohol dehydrogenase family)